MNNLDALWDAVDALEYDELCIAMAYMLTRGLQAADTFATDVQNELDMIAMLAGIREQMEGKNARLN